MSKWKLCKGCDQPMLPKGQKKKPGEFDHARGCPLAKKIRLASNLERDHHKAYIKMRVTRAMRHFKEGSYWGASMNLRMALRRMKFFEKQYCLRRLAATGVR